MRARRDLRIELQTQRQASSWLVHDPVALRTYQLGRHEKFILEQLDGRRSLAELKRLFEKQFAPQKLDLDELQAFLTVMHREGLVLTDAHGQGTQLLIRRNELLSRQRWLRAINWLAIRFPGIDPSPLLRLLEPRTRRLFTPAVQAMAMVLIVIAAGMIVHAAVQGRLPSWESLLNWQTAVFLFVAVGLAKALHELGHALTCVHFGGQCTEVGLMLLIGSPSLYCDVSSSVMFTEKWKRIAVSAAGMYVELIIAAVCVWVWHFSEPGPLPHFCLALAIVCSVNSLLFNGNPLLRFDGYYILADYLEIPNLQSRASQQLHGLVGRFFLGGAPEPASESAGAPRALLLTYAVLSLLYRLAILLSIIWMVYVVLSHHGALFIAHWVAAVVLFNGLILPHIGQLKGVLAPGRRRQYRWRRLTFVGLATVTLFAALYMVPWPQRLELPAVIHPRQAARVFVVVPGRLTDCLEVGQQVEPGQTLGQLENLELDLQIAQIQSQVHEQEQHVQNLQRTQGSEPLAGDQLPTAQTALEELRERLHQRLADRDRLTLRAPRAGMVLPATNLRTTDEMNELDHIEGAPTDPRNRHRYLEVGTYFCQVGDPRQQEAVAVAPAVDVSLLQAGQTVELRFLQRPQARFSGTVRQISAVDASTSRATLSETAMPEPPTSATTMDSSSTESPTYQVRIELDDEQPWLTLGTQGIARVTVRSESLGRRCWRQLRGSFAWGL